MFAYFKKRSDFSFAGASDVIDYDICLSSIYDSVSKITIQGQVPGETGDFVIIGKYIGIIKSHKYDDGISEITANDILFLFDRGLLFDLPAAPPTTEEYICQLIRDNYVEQPDTVFALPYLIINEPSTSTSWLRPELENGVFSIKSYSAACRREQSVYLDFSFTNDNLIIDVRKRTPPEHKINFDSSEFELTAANFAAKAIAKITAVTDAKLGEATTIEDGKITLDEVQFLSRIKNTGEYVYNYTGGKWHLDTVEVSLLDYGIVIAQGEPTEDSTITIEYEKERKAVDYYKMSDGTITTDPDAGERISGEWQTIFCDLENQTALEKIANEFSKNTNNLSIEFYSYKDYGFYDTVHIRLNGQLFNSYISQKFIQSDDDRFFYKVGSQKVTFKEKQLEVI